MLQLASGIFGLVLFAFWAWAILDVVLTDKAAFRRMNKPFWFILVLFAAQIGAIAWLAFGRPANVGFAPGAKLSVKDFLAPAASVRGPEDDAAWSTNTAPSLPSDRLVREAEPDFDEWEAEFSERDQRSTEDD